MTNPITRREALFSLAAAPLLAQPAKRQLPVKALSHVTLSVSDPKRSLEFYQGLFGFPIQAYQGPNDSAPPSLRIGAGPQFLFLSGLRGNGKPGFDHFCMTTPDFSVDRVTGILAEHGIAKAEAPGGGATKGPVGISGGALKFRVRIRDERTGGAKEGTPEFYIGDPDGLTIQLQDTTYCGGSGPMGEVCLAKPVEAPKKGLIALKDFSHYTLFASDAQRSIKFYQDLFAMPVQTHQGAMPLLAVGTNRQFLAIANSGADRPPSINHACFTMENFNPDKILKTLAEFGIKARGDASDPPAPLVSYVTIRGEDRGGSKEGTPELYFTDPDGILMQIQDAKYCGGAGRLGEICSG